jgi:hypothetical protein
MAPEKRDKTIAALEAVHTALKGLSATERQRVLASVYALLEISASSVSNNKRAEASDELAGSAPVSAPVAVPIAGARPLAIRELIQEKKPHSHPQFITLFAYFRERHENHPTFSRDDLKRYYTASRENPPKNFDRDFVEAIKKGWIHEDNDNSYITSKGIEAVESGFAGSSEKTVRAKVRPAKKKMPNKKRT